ncbi:MAG TPA: hypothetical protein VFV97_06480 [Rhodanobacteraceae bacterium]|nr:hypothetical protein [Rhodanobacteraceae bacterium]
MIRPLLITLLLAAGAAEAQQMPPGPPGPPPHPQGGAPSPEALASIPDLDAAKQIEVRKILIQRRDAHDALRAKEDAEREAARTRYRAEHERIDDESSARLRKLLGDDGYRTLSAWLVSPRGGMRPGGPGPDRPRGGPPRPGAATRFNDPALPLPPDPDHDGGDSPARLR